MKVEKGTVWMYTVQIFLTPDEAKLLASAIRAGQNSLAEKVRLVCKGAQ